MKTLGYLILGLFITSSVCQGQITDPGWFRASNPLPAPQSHHQAAALVPAATAGAHPLALPMGASFVPAMPVAEAITPQIQALADGLQDDPMRIFDYVHDHIKFVLYFGSKKGAQLTLLEKSGNDFDQSALLVALLRAAGYTNAPGSDHGVGYQFGWMAIPYDDSYHYDLHHWWQLTLNNSNWTNTSTYLRDLCGSRGYPTSYAFAGVSVFELQRTWVLLTIGATTYNLDPAFKISEPVSGIALTNALGASGATISNALWSAAGGTSTTNSVSGMSESSVRSALTGYTTNLLNYLQSNAPNASVKDILGGWQIVAAYNPWDYTTSPLFYVDDWSGSMPVLTWANAPTNLMSTLSVTFAGTNQQWFVPELQGQRLALTFDGSGLGQLWLDDTNVAQHSTSGSSGTTNVVLSIAHPVGTWDFINNAFIPNPTNSDNQVVTNAYRSTNATYALLYAFEPDWGWLQQRQNKLDSYLEQGLTNGSREVVSESLNVMGLNWMLQTAGAEQMLARQLGILPQYFHRLGRMAQETGKGYYVDVYMQLSGSFPSGGDDTAHIQQTSTEFDLLSVFASALEHGIIEQLQNTNLVGASTVKMLQIASTNGQAVYLANSANWSSIQGSLVNYGSTVLNQINTRFISQGYSVLMPANGSNHVAGAGSWAGYGYEARQVVSGQTFDSQMIIAGDYHGGYVSDPTAVVNTLYVDLSAQTQPNYFSATPVLSAVVTGADPVDLADGTFQVESTDLALGQTEPRGLGLTRSYNGARHYRSTGGLTGGWTHNYCATAATVAAPQAGLGGTTPAQAAPMIAATAASIALYNGVVASPKNWTLTALIAKWGVDQLTKGGACITLGKDTLQFVQQPNGVFTPPANCTFTLTKANNAYSLHERHGRTFNFDTINRLAGIVDQYSSVSNSLTYNASNWVSTVKDWKNRTFTFNYTGSPQRLTSVTDGTRAVSYGYSTAYSARGDLVSATDPESGTSTFAYDTNHQITATFDALNRLVVSNLYDTQWHVAAQYTQGDTNKTWRIFWSGWQTTTIDPAGGQRDYFYDDETRLVALFDEVGGLSSSFYDGQNHIIATVSPLSEINQFIFDGNHNPIYLIDPLGFTNTLVYDSKFNLIQSIDPRANSSYFGWNTQFSLTGSTNGAGDWVTFTYNADGTMNTRVDPGGTTTYGHDTWGQVNSIVFPGSLGTNGFLNNALGDTLSVTNGRGFVTSFQFNLRRQLTNTIAPTNLTMRASVDAVGNLQTTTDARSNTTTRIWSPTRKLLSTTFPSTPQGVPVITNIYDVRDWLLRTLDPLLSAIGYSNDLAGRLIALTDPVLRASLFGYDLDGRRTATTNAALEVANQAWSARGEAIKSTDPASNVVSRLFDTAGNNTTLTNRNGKVWQFQFDKANRLTNTITPLNRSTKIALNNRGLVSTIVQPSGKTATNTYDPRNRLTNRADQVGSKAYRFDLNNNMTSVIEAGKSNSWSFDAYDRAFSYKDSDGNLIQYRMDQNGNVTNLVYPGGKNVYYAFDSLNRLTNVTDWVSRKTSFTWDLASRLTSITRPNGTKRIINYDAAGETTNIVEQTSTGGPIAFFKLDWNSAARMDWEFTGPLPHPFTPVSRTMTFDDDNRLATFNGSYVTNDSDGNLIWGPLTNGTFGALTFNARNQLLSAGGLSYGYDPAGNRTSITNGTNITRFVINPAAALSQVLMRVKNGVTNYYVYGVGLLYEADDAGNTRTYHFDYRGSSIAITDGNGYVTDRAEYSIYGTITYRGGTTDTPFLYNGRYGVMTDANGLLFMRSRYYNPYLCRFINPDPRGFSGGLNFYQFANGTPVSYRDPSGLGAVGDNQVTSWLNGSSGTPTDLSNPFGLNTQENNKNLQKCIVCHGVSAGGFNGDVNSFYGLTAIPGSGPNAMQGYSTLEHLSIAAAPLVAGPLGAAIGASLDTAVVAGGGAIMLAEGETVIGVVINGQVVRQSVMAPIASHAAAAQAAGALTAEGTLIPGAQAFTAINSGGRIVVLGSGTFGGTLNVSQATITAVRAFLAAP